MTNREFYEIVINANISEDATAHAQNALAALDHTNELRKARTAEKAAAKAAERAPLRESIANAMTAEPQTATMLIEAAGVELKPQAIPSLLKPLIESGEVNRVEMKIPGKGKQVGYVRA